MNPQVPKVLQENCKQGPETGKEKTGIISSTVKSLTAIALACTLSGIPQKGEAQNVTQTVFKTETTLVSSGESLTEMQKESRFVDAINALPEEGQTELIPGLTIIQALESFGTNDEFLNKAIGYFIYGFSVDKAILKVYYDNFFDKLEGANNQADIMRALHNEAISLGREEYVHNSLQYDPDFQEGGYYGDETPEQKEASAIADFEDIFGAFLDGRVQTVDSIIRLGRYAPEFSNYVIQFEGDFPTDVLVEVIGLVDAKKESVRTKEELVRAKEESAESEKELALKFQEMVDAMKQIPLG